MRKISLTAALVAATLSTAAVAAEPKPESRIAREAHCRDSATPPSWCNDPDVRFPNNPNAFSSGGWTVILKTDDMDVDKSAAIIANLYSDSDVVGTFTITVWNGGETVEHNSSIQREEYWPFCSHKADRIAVDGGEVMYLAGITRYATCDEISHNGRAISAMKRGSRARIRLGSHGGDFDINLNGFTFAYDRAVSLTRRK